jgi:hypothetical protein
MTSKYLYNSTNVLLDCGLTPTNASVVLTRSFVTPLYDPATDGDIIILGTAYGSGTNMNAIMIEYDISNPSSKKPSGT